MRISKSQLDDILKKNKQISISDNQIIKKVNKAYEKLAINFKANKEIILNPITPNSLEFIVKGTPVACPRMTQRDKWMKRPCVMKYREYADRLREFINLNDLYVGRVEMKFFLAMPDSWSKKKKIEMLGKPHQVKPDWDNLAKGVQDALLQNDSMICQAYVEKLWVFEGFERTELRFSIK